MKTDAEIENNNHSVVSNFHSTVINKSTSIESLQTTPAVDSKIIQNRISIILLKLMRLTLNK